MSLEGLLKELEMKKAMEKEKQLELQQERHITEIQAKEQEISALKEEIETLRCWLDHSALPAHNPIAKRKDSLNLVKMNFGEDKKCPDLWNPGERELLDSIKKEPQELRIPAAPKPGEEQDNSEPETLVLDEPLTGPDFNPDDERPKLPEPDLDERPNLTDTSFSLSQPGETVIEINKQKLKDIKTEKKSEKKTIKAKLAKTKKTSKQKSKIEKTNSK